MAPSSIEELISAPVDRFSAGPTHLVWCHSPDLCGTCHWGRPGEKEATQLIRRLDFSLHPALAGGFDVVTDAREVEAFDWQAFGIVSRYVRDRLPEWTRRIRRQAIVVSAGIPGIFVAGMMPLLGATHPLRVFDSMAGAIEWLGLQERAATFEEVEHLVRAARGVPPLVQALRDHLDRSLPGANLDEAARALALSPRSLQRQLRRSGTAFGAELFQARLRAAALLLQHSDEKIAAIAKRVGCTSSRLSTLFRRQYGTTPAGYRARTRRD